MTGRRMLTMAAAAAFGLGLIAASANAAKECAKDCAQVKKDCIRAAVAEKKACPGGDKKACKAALKTAKKACVTAFKSGKQGCKEAQSDTSICSPASKASPAGAVLAD